MKGRELRHPHHGSPDETDAGDANAAAIQGAQGTTLIADDTRARRCEQPPLPTRSPTSIDFRAIILSLLDDPEVVAKVQSKVDLAPMDAGSDYETVAETAKRYRLSTRTIRRAMAIGLPFDRPVGRRVRIPVAKARAWFESGKGRALDRKR
jgi:hypothetical protein